MQKAALITFVVVGANKAVFSTRVIVGANFLAVGAAAKPLRRRIALRLVCENLTAVGRINLPNGQAYPLPI